MLPGKRMGVSAAIFLAIAFLAAIAFLSGNRTALAGHRGAPEATRPAPRNRPAELGSKIPLSAIRPNYGSLPLSFETNEGQAPADVQFVAHGADYALLLSPKGAVVSVEQQSGADPYLAKLDAKTQKKLSHRKLYHALAQARGRHRRHDVRIQFDDANLHARLQPLDELPGKTNYLIGNDRHKWLTGIPNYGRIRYSSIYPGVDLVYYGNQRQLEFDFVVSPGADPNVIALKFDGREHLSPASDGTLRLGSRQDQDVVVLHRPSIYQVENGRKRTVQGGFVLLADRRVGIRVGAYDKTKPLVVDPVLAYSTYLSGSAGADVDGIAVDANGDAYVVGATPSTDFPVVNGYQSTGNANYVAFISKFDPTGATLLYSTYLGGTGGDYGYGIALDPTGNVYVSGYSFSTDFPIVNGFQTANNNPTYGNAFVARLDTTQSGAASLLYSSYLGGGGNSTNSTQGYGDLGFGIAVDAYGLAYVTGVTTSDTSVTPFPTTAGAYQSSLASPNGNAFLTVLDTNQSGSSSLVYSTYLGGDGAGSLIGDIGDSVAVDGSGDAYLAGQTTSDSSGPFPTTSGAYQSSLNSPNGNAFVAEISTTQSGAQSLVYSSYFGGSTTSIVGDWGENITLDATGKVYITGGADSSDFPVTSSAFQTTNSEGGKAFAAKFDLTQSGSQSLVYSTFLGGTNGGTGENGNGIAVDSNGDAYVVGCTSSSDFPTTSDAFQSTLKSSGVNAYLSELNPGGTALEYSTYLGGSSEFGDVATSVALDSSPNPYVAGYTDSSDFPTLNAFQSSLNGGQSGFVTKFALVANPEISASPSPGPNAAGWNNSAVMVTFTCVPGAAPIQSCTSPITVSTEGANQVVSGTAVDTANNTASASDTVNLDLTPPTLSISSPSNGATLGTPYVIISGTLTDSLSGPGSVNCGGVPAVLTGTNFSCTVLLSSVSNSIVVTGSDVAGNTASSTINVTVSMPAPTSLTVSPANPNMVIGGTQAFTAIDQTGTSRPDATWSVSDTTIASFSGSSPNALVGNAAGTVTVTATVGSVTGQTTVTVLAGSLAVGTVLWSAPALSGYTAQQIVQAVPTANGPDLYEIDSGPNGDTLVRAFKSDGEQLWQSDVAGQSTAGMNAVGDNLGGVVLPVCSSGCSGPSGALDFNPQTGAQNWQYSAIGNLQGDLAVGLDGTIYIVENISSGVDEYPYLDAINGTTGALLNQYQLPYSTRTNPDCIDPDYPGTIGPPHDRPRWLAVHGGGIEPVCRDRTKPILRAGRELDLQRAVAAAETDPRRQRPPVHDPEFLLQFVFARCLGIRATVQHRR